MGRRAWRYSVNWLLIGCNYVAPMVDELNMSMERWWKDVERSDRDKRSTGMSHFSSAISEVSFVDVIWIHSGWFSV